MSRTSTLERIDVRKRCTLDTGLHLVLDLEQILEAQALGGEGLQRFANVRQAFPGIVLTIHTDRSAGEAIRILERSGLPLPDHLLAASGTVVFHGEAGQRLVMDPEYDEWLAFQGNFRSQAGAAKAVGVEFLEIGWATPRPLVVVGRADRDLSLLGLADIPILRLESQRRTDASSFLTTRTFLLEGPGLSETVRIILAYLAPVKRGYFFHSGSRQGGSRRTSPFVQRNDRSWRIEPGKREKERGSPRPRH